MFNKVLIIGCGLIGSSILRAIKNRKLARNIYIFEKSKKHISLIKKINKKIIFLKKLDQNISDVDLVVLSRLRQKAQAANSYRTLKNRYRRLVNIPQEDQEQFLEMVGDLPTWLRLDTLLPEAAKELVRSTTLQE